MCYVLTPAQIIIQQTVRKFAVSELQSIATKIDREHRFPKETVQRMADLNLFTLSVPKEYGGQGKDTLDCIIAIEELAKVCASHAVILSSHTLLCTHAILYFGNKLQTRNYIPHLISDKSIGAFCLTEKNAGTDASAQETTATLAGDNYILNGHKIFITNATAADIFIVMAMTDPNAGLKGISAFIVEKKFIGFSIGQIEEKMGICGSTVAEIHLNNCHIPKNNLLGKEGQGFEIAMNVLDGGRLGIAAQAIGIAQGALDASISYAKNRKQFNRPISTNQGIQWYLAEMATKVEAARLLLYQAASLKDRGKKYTKEAAMSKLFASTVAMEVTTKAVQIFGGVGYTRAYPVERYMRDAKITEIYEGTSEAMKMVIAKNILS